MSDPIPTRESLAGFIVTEPRLTTTSTGQQRLAARVGVEHWVKELDGSRTELDPTFYTLAIFGPLAQRLEGRFRQGDRFVAAGHTTAYTPDRSGVTELRHEFVATRIGHDAARTRYTVDRGITARHPAGLATARDAALPEPGSETTASGPRLRVVPDPPAQPTQVRPTGPLDSVDSPLGS
ncbi:MAG: hypothetical protein K0R97_617 [Oerskovia sp.]|jgi:single-stranded DNA-binding protein|nr:hypothetical protein [Oerskovia sp.]